MDYGQAHALMTTHAERVLRGGGFMRDVDQNAKKLKNATWLLKGAQSMGGIAYVLELFRKPIIQFYDDRVSLNDHGYFSRTTHDRFNEYLPRGFRVWGQYIPWLKRTLGFVKTPMGVFPYNMPTNFSYDGHNLDGLHARAAETVARIPAYVERYLTDLFDNKNSYKENSLLEDNVAENIYLNVTRRDLIVVCESAVASNECVYGGMHIVDVVRVLIEEGAAAFKAARTKTQRADRTERLVKYQRALPIIHAGGLKKRLRWDLRQYLVNQMEFDSVEWHRREHGA